MHELSIARRGQEVQASPIRRLVPLANRAKDQGIRVYHLNIGQPDIETPPEYFRAIYDADIKILAYGESGGQPELRAGLVPYYASFGVDVNEQEILITTGGSEAVLFCLLTCCNPGDEVLTLEPFYTNYNSFATMAGISIVPVPGSPADGFRLPPDDLLESLISSRTKAILFSNPGNPTGVVYTRSELERLGRLAVKNGLFILADEVYREFIYDGSVFTSILSIDGLAGHAVICDSISKRFSACGARIGNIVTHNLSVLEAALKFGMARLCPPALEQIGAVAALKVPEAYYARVREEYQLRRDVIYQGILAIPGAQTYLPKGAFYSIAVLPVEDTNDFAAWMLSDFSYEGATVMVAPADGFYATPGAGRNEIRLAYVLNRQDLNKAMLILQKGLCAYNSR
ncbi:MAG: pyridoxal phosphate-dependent aminotransferase [Symbiobacteriaceae bacterium]|nr:pyridoxal phosphate-dependent aminotransferase [Symbiobacteriaceae bacterium]